MGYHNHDQRHLHRHLRPIYHCISGVLSALHILSHSILTIIVVVIYCWITHYFKSSGLKYQLFFHYFVG